MLGLEPLCSGLPKPACASPPQLDRSTREVELGLDYGTPTMNLAGQSLKFENGQWIAGGLHFLPFCPARWWKETALVTAACVLPPETGISGGVDRREAQRLRRRNQQLEEENNLLRLKVDILLDMVRRVVGREALAFLGQVHCESFQPAHTSRVPVCSGTLL